MSRISITFAHDKDGWDVCQAKELKKIGGGNLPGVKYPIALHFQVPFAEAVKRDDDIPHPTAIGMITDPREAERFFKKLRWHVSSCVTPTGSCIAVRDLGVPVNWVDQSTVSLLVVGWT
ncbi:hypothetical protein O0I10_009723 [Lichtheimia ornata]|uniref:Uncharacterized protein n=1 Tax=Lichtheimia ornata TaxID=688661 RepID=A0AAD7UWG0_9FUNG|nr:uncharacterized protein O0I10_009723 [Lichtheimia ornata]KAJ8654672.1 hypothetical protein O0I10_009723 [Lichtheimia ornata]